MKLDTVAVDVVRVFRLIDVTALEAATSCSPSRQSRRRLRRVLEVDLEMPADIVRLESLEDCTVFGKIREYCR